MPYDHNTINQNTRKIEITDEHVYITHYYPNSNMIYKVIKYKRER